MKKFVFNHSMSCGVSASLPATYNIKHKLYGIRKNQKFGLNTMPHHHPTLYCARLSLEWHHKGHHQRHHCHTTSHQFAMLAYIHCYCCTKLTVIALFVGGCVHSCVVVRVFSQSDNQNRKIKARACCFCCCCVAAGGVTAVCHRLWV